VITTEQSISIEAGIDRVWDYVRDIRRWANLFPGCRECQVISDNESRWIIKVGAGGLVRTVTVLVHVDEWNGPGGVDFTFKLEGDPVQGGGSYRAVSRDANGTDVTLSVQVAGSGSMAPMWEAMSKPLLPQLAKSFAGQLKREIEAAAPAAPTIEPVPVKSSSLLAVLRRFFASLRRLKGQPKST